MNKVYYKIDIVHTTTLEEVIKNGETAFVGCYGNGPDDSLYLITSDRIVLAKAPKKTWDSPNCTVKIDRYVDVEIKEISK